MINPWVAARTFLIVSDSPNAFSYLRKGLLFYVVTICPSAVHPVGCYYFTNSNNYQSSIPSEWNVDAECPRRYSKVFVYYNCVFTSTEKSNFVAVWNLVGGVTCITGKTVTILSFSIRAMCLNLYLKICTEHKGGFRVKQSAWLLWYYTQKLINNSLCSCHLVCYQMTKLHHRLNNTLQWFLIHYNQTPVQVKWHF